MCRDWLVSLQGLVRQKLAVCFDVLYVIRLQVVIEISAVNFVR